MGLLTAYLVVSLVAGPVQKPDAREAEVARHQGVWRVVASVRDGEAAPDEIARSIVRVVEGDHVVWKRDGKSFAGTTVTLDPSSTPKAIDVTPDGGKLRDQRVLGIYKLEGDALTICMASAGKPRPKTFEAPAGSGLMLMTFTREKP